MAKQPPVKGSGVMGALTRKFKGVPAWIILIAVGAGLYLYRKHQASSAATATTATAPASSPGYAGGYGDLGGGGGGAPPAPTPEPDPNATNSSEQSRGELLSAFTSALSSLAAAEQAQSSQPIVVNVAQPEPTAITGPSGGGPPPNPNGTVAQLKAAGFSPQVIPLIQNITTTAPGPTVQDQARQSQNEPLVITQTVTAPKKASATAAASKPKAVAKITNPEPGSHAAQVRKNA